MTTDLDYEFIKAAAIGNSAKFEQLINEGANINAQGPMGTTALMWAATNGHADCVKLLLANGADDTLTELIDGYTALMAAAHWGCAEACKELSKNTSVIDIKDSGGKTALDIAKEQGHVECAKIIEAAFINLPTGNGRNL